MRKKIVIFGAGKIGRSFIGQLFSQSGYQVVFVDISSEIIDALNQKKEYKVVIKDQQEKIITVKNVSGILADEFDSVKAAVAESDLIAISVGKSAIPKVLPIICQGLLLRYRKNKNNPLDIILAENMRNAASFVREELNKTLPGDYPIHNLVGLVETSIGKMVPIMTQKDEREDILQVFAESYNTLILDKQGFKNPIPSVDGLAPKENMKAWVDRKSFIHNLGHATTAYLGHLYDPGFVYTYEVLEIDELFTEIRSTMRQAAAILLKVYPQDFTYQDLDNHIDDLLHRFSNKSLGDTIYRVGLDVKRKLGKNDRLNGAIHLARQYQMPYDHILYAAVCGTYFKATDAHGKLNPNDQEFFREYNHDLHRIFSEIAGYDLKQDQDIFAEILIIDQKIKKRFIIN